MYGRFAVVSRKVRIAERFRVEPVRLEVVDQLRYNVALPQVCLMIRACDLGWLALAVC